MRRTRDHTKKIYQYYISPGATDVIEPDSINMVVGNKDGTCQAGLVAAEPGYRNCGFERALFKACFSDRGKGGKKKFDPRKVWSNEKVANRAFHYCSSIVRLKLLNTFQVGQPERSSELILQDVKKAFEAALLPSVQVENQPTYQLVIGDAGHHQRGMMIERIETVAPIFPGSLVTFRPKIEAVTNLMNLLGRELFLCKCDSDSPNMFSACLKHIMGDVGGGAGNGDRWISDEIERIKNLR